MNKNDLNIIRNLMRENLRSIDDETKKAAAELLIRSTGFGESFSQVIDRVEDISRLRDEIYSYNRLLEKYGYGYELEPLIKEFGWGVDDPVYRGYTTYRTDEEILAQTNRLAHALISHDGYEPTDPDYKFYQHLDNPRALKYWNLACIAQAHLTDTDVSDLSYLYDET